MPNRPIQSPAGYVPSRAAAFADPAGDCVVVSAATPLPVALADPGDQTPPPVAGNAVASMTAGPFTPARGRQVVVTLSGNWSGSARLLRSVDGGQTRHPLTAGGQPWGQYTTNCCEAVWEESVASATLYLDIALTGGAVAWRIEQ